MDACMFDSLLGQMAQLSRHQCARVLALLKPRVDQTSTVDVLQAAAARTEFIPRKLGSWPQPGSSTVNGYSAFHNASRRFTRPHGVAGIQWYARRRCPGTSRETHAHVSNHPVQR